MVNQRSQLNAYLGQSETIVDEAKSVTYFPNDTREFCVVGATIDVLDQCVILLGEVEELVCLQELDAFDTAYRFDRLMVTVPRKNYIRMKDIHCKIPAKGRHYCKAAIRILRMVVKGITVLEPKLEIIGLRIEDEEKIDFDFDLNKEVE